METYTELPHAFSPAQEDFYDAVSAHVGPIQRSEVTRVLAGLEEGLSAEFVAGQIMRSRTRKPPSARQGCTAQIIEIDDAAIIVGRRAWLRILDAPAARCDLWRKVGRALLIGRQRNPQPNEFDAWCVQTGFGDIDPRARIAAILLVEKWLSFTTCEHKK